MRLHRLLASLAVVPLTLGVGAVQVLAGETRTETRTENLAFGAKLWVKNRNGSIKVTGWDKEQVALNATIRDSDKRKVELVVHRVGTDLDIEALFQQPTVVFNLGFSQSPKCDMVLQVPYRLAAAFRTTNGDVQVVRLEGYASCEATNGDIVVRDIKGEVAAETTNGDIQAHNLNARIKGGTTNGRIRLEDVAGGVKLETTNGSVVARGLDGWGEGIALETTNGSIEVALGRATGDLTAENSNGSINVTVPNASVLESAKHSVHLRLPGKQQKISLETTNGSITIKQ